MVRIADQVYASKWQTQLSCQVGHIYMHYISSITHMLTIMIGNHSEIVARGVGSCKNNGKKKLSPFWIHNISKNFQLTIKL